MRPLPISQIRETKWEFNDLRTGETLMVKESRYFNELALHMKDAIYRAEAYGASYDDLVITMNHKTLSKLLKMLNPYLTVQSPYGEHMFGLPIRLDMDMQDGHVCLMERKYEFADVDDDWWEN